MVEPVGHVGRGAPAEAGVLQELLDRLPGVWFEAWARKHVVSLLNWEIGLLLPLPRFFTTDIGIQCLLLRALECAKGRTAPARMLSSMTDIRGPSSHQGGRSSC